MVEKISQEDWAKLFYTLCDNSAPQDVLIGEYKGKFIENLTTTNYDSYGAMENNYKLILHFPEENSYIALLGTYYSYDGSNFIKAQEVKPVTKTYNTYE